MMDTVLVGRHDGAYANVPYKEYNWAPMCHIDIFVKVINNRGGLAKNSLWPKQFAFNSSLPVVASKVEAVQSKALIDSGT